MSQNDMVQPLADAITNRTNYRLASQNMQCWLS